MPEYVACNLCGEIRFSIKFPGTLDRQNLTRIVELHRATSPEFSLHGDIVECAGCGHIYANPRFTEEELASIYARTIDEDYLGELPSRGLTATKNLELLDKHVSMGRMLDVGCSIGVLLDVARKRGWETYGVEPSVWASEFARKRLMLDVFTGTLHDAKLPPNYFDLVILSDVLEHLPDPVAVLREVWEVIKPDGLLWINTPNIGSALARLLGSRWYCVTLPHIHYFSSSTLNVLLREVGFEPVYTRSYGRYFTLGYCIDRLKQFSPPLYTLLRTIAQSLRLGSKVVRIDFRDQMLVYAKKRDLS